MDIVDSLNNLILDAMLIFSDNLFILKTVFVNSQVGSIDCILNKSLRNLEQ